MSAVTVSDEEIATDQCFLATGNSTRNVYTMLAESGVPLTVKPFAVGVRVEEMPQSLLNIAQYGRWAKPPRLRSTSFQLTRKPGQTIRGCYSFYTRPGRLVMSCASYDGLITTNGMSYSS